MVISKFLILKIDSWFLKKGFRMYFKYLKIWNINTDCLHVCKRNGHVPKALILRIKETVEPLQVGTGMYLNFEGRFLFAYFFC